LPQRPLLWTKSGHPSLDYFIGAGDQWQWHCFGSKADICAAKSDVRFTPNSDRKSGLPHKVTSALPPKADMCGAKRNVRFGPKADIMAHGG
jgi:hypothetical protein